MTATSGGSVPTRRNSDLRRRNRLDVVDLLRRRGRLSRADLAELTTLSSQGLASILNELVESDVVVEVAMRGGQRSRGRPALLYEFNPDRFCVMSLYVGLRYSELSLCDGLGRRIGDNVEFTPGWDPAVVVEQAATHIESMRRAAGLLDRPCHVGVVVHGWVDETLGEATSQGMGWDRVPILPMLADRTGLEVAIFEASRAAAIAESREGAAVGSPRATVVNSGPEMMAALLVDGELDTGASGQAGMIGRCVVATSEGVRSIGALIGSVASVRRYNELTGDDVEWMSEVYARARAGDPDANTVVALQVEAMAFAASWVLAIDDPERLVFTGAIADFPEHQRSRLHAAIVELADRRIVSRSTIRFSTLGRQAWIRGGIHAALAHQSATDIV